MLSDGVSITNRCLFCTVYSEKCDTELKNLPPQQIITLIGSL